MITHCELSIVDFVKHLKLFEENPEYILDSIYAEKLTSFGTWFCEKLRDPRNKIIVHQKGNHFVPAVGTDETLKRLRYALLKHENQMVWFPVESIELSEISLLIKKIKFLDSITKYFRDKLKFS